MILFLEPARGPTTTITVVSSTVLRVTWSKLSAADSNGVITKYDVCYQRGSTLSRCTNWRQVTDVRNRVIDLTGLKPATMYTVAVRAVTAIGVGPLGNAKSEKTLEDSEYFLSHRWYYVQV